MTGRRTIVGLCMLCALALSAIAAQSAAAIPTGTTAFTCVEGVNKQFDSEHCSTTVGGAKFGHVVVPQDETTEIIGTNAKTNSTTTGSTITALTATISGVATELQATTVEGGPGSWMTNAIDPVTGEHYTHGEGDLVYTGITVTKPAEKGCKLKGENKITTKPLKATTKAQGMNLLFEPKEGTVFATFEIEGCSVAALNGLYEVKGKVAGEPTGATTVFTSAATTAQGTLTVRGQKAGIDGKLTISGRAKGESTYKPLSTTTIATP